MPNCDCTQKVHYYHVHVESCWQNGASHRDMWLDNALVWFGSVIFRHIEYEMDAIAKPNKATRNMTFPTCIHKCLNEIKNDNDSFAPLFSRIALTFETKNLKLPSITARIRMLLKTFISIRCSRIISATHKLLPISTPMPLMFMCGLYLLVNTLFLLTTLTHKDTSMMQQMWQNNQTNEITINI